MPDDSWMRLLYLGVLLAALAGWAVLEVRKSPGKTLKSLLAWGMVILGLMAVYGLWGDIQRGLRPGQEASASEVTLPRAEDGHYYAQLDIGGQTVEFMVDTGASDVVLSPQDAARIGIDADSLAFLGQANTANGVVRTARVTLKDVTFGPFTDKSLGASVNQGRMELSLLGMSYLGQFQISIAADRMVLRR